VIPLCHSALHPFEILDFYGYRKSLKKILVSSIKSRTYSVVVLVTLHAAVIYIASACKRSRRRSVIIIFYHRTKHECCTLYYIVYTRNIIHFIRVGRAHRVCLAVQVLNRRTLCTYRHIILLCIITTRITTAKFIIIIIIIYYNVQSINTFRPRRVTREQHCSSCVARGCRNVYLNACYTYKYVYRTPMYQLYRRLRIPMGI